MPRLRQTNTIITDISQISEGDLLLFRGNCWDTLGIAIISSGAMRFRLDEVQTSRDYSYSITDVEINLKRYMKIDPETYLRVRSEQEAYKREHYVMEGYRTGLFPCRD